MVKSLRYDHKGCDNFGDVVSFDGLRRTSYTHAGADIYGNPTPDSHAASHGDTDARIDLPRAKSCGKVGCTRSI